MARITVEDCLENVGNRFELVILAAKRARELTKGSVEPKIEWGSDKPTVLALREIADGHITQDYMDYDPLAENISEVDMDSDGLQSDIL